MRRISLALGVAALLAVPVESFAAPSSAEKRRRRPRPPRVRRIRPRHRSTFVKLDTTLRVVFNRPVDPASITEQSVSFGKLSGESVPWTFRMERRDRVLILVPQKTLEPGVDYRISIREGVRSRQGVALRRERSANFFTDAKFSGFVLLRPDQFVQLPATMGTGRALHTATEISGGRVLLAGGISDSVTITDTADVFDPLTNEFFGTVGRMASPRVEHAAVSYTAGAWILGGDDGVRALDTVEVFGGTGFGVGPSMTEERAFHAAVVLSRGRILVVGGLRYQGNNAIFSTTAEMYRPDEGVFRRTLNDPLHRRAGHTLTLLPDGRVLIVGGRGDGPVPAEIFDPATETFRETLFSSAEIRQRHTATLLDEDVGSVLIADGGSPRVEVWDPDTERFFAAGGSSFSNRTLTTASLLPSGNVLLAGGLEGRGSTTLILEGMDVFKRDLGDLGRVLRAAVVFPQPRAGHTATTLRDDRVFIAGGLGVDGPSLNSAIIFTPDPADE